MTVGKARRLALVGSFSVMVLTVNPHPAEAFKFFQMGGEQSCAAAMKPDEMLLTAAWLTGFWTGLNKAGERKLTGSSKDATAIFELVFRFCQLHPTAELYEAVQAIYDATATLQQ